MVRPAEQGNAVDAFGPEPVRVSDASAGLGATDCGRSAVEFGIVISWIGSSDIIRYLRNLILYVYHHN